MGRGLLDLLLAPICAGCEAEADPLCDPCRLALVGRGGPACHRCGERLAGPESPCRSDHGSLAGLAWHAAPYAYRGTGGALVRRFKLDANAAAGRVLARSMADVLRPLLVEEWRRPSFVPVPLHAARARSRGFDQARWLATGIASRLGSGRVENALVRVAPTLPQGDPRVRSRERNVAAAFAVRKRCSVVGARVLLVDDVFTSGATARTCSRLLREAGAADVALVTACRSGSAGHASASP